MNRRDERRQAAVRLTCVGLVLVLLSCGAKVDQRDPYACGGKCDGNLAGRFVDLFRDPSTFEPGDLSKWSADFVTRRINDAISLPSAGLAGGASVTLSRPRLAKTDVYALEERADHSLTFKSLRALTAGLTQAYGEQEYFTRINALRVQHLHDNPRAVWTEARFELPTNLFGGGLGGRLPGSRGTERKVIAYTLMRLASTAAPPTPS